MQILTDDEIICRVRDGDTDAFKLLVERYEATVAGIVTSVLGDSSDADDVGQEVFIRFFSKIDSFEGRSSVGTYLSRIAINLSINELKRKSRKKIFFLNFNQTQAVYENYEKSDYKEEINKCLLTLGPKLQKVVVLRLVEGYSTRETAEILQLPEGTVLSRLSRATEKLKQMLSNIKR